MQNKPEVQAKIAISLQFAVLPALFCAVQSKSTCREGIFHFFWCTFQGVFMLMNEITCNEEKCQSI